MLIQSEALAVDGLGTLVEGELVTAGFFKANGRGDAAVIWLDGLVEVWTAKETAVAAVVSPVPSCWVDASLDDDGRSGRWASSVCGASNAGRGNGGSGNWSLDKDGCGGWCGGSDRLDEAGRRWRCAGSGGGNERL